VILEMGAFAVDFSRERGGKIVALRRAGVDRNLLFAPDAPLALDDGGDTFAVAGWDEAFPTVAASAGLPGWGTAWRGFPEQRLVRNGVEHRWTMPGYAFERTLRAEGDALTAAYRWSNTTEDALPALWAAHALYPTTGLQDTRLPDAELVAGPQCILDELEAHLVRDARGWGIADFGRNGLSWKFFVPAVGPATLRYADVTLTIETDAGWWGVFLNRGRFGEPCVGIEPTTHPTDFAAEAPALGAGETRSVWWRLRASG